MSQSLKKRLQVSKPIIVPEPTPQPVAQTAPQPIPVPVSNRKKTYNSGVSAWKLQQMAKKLHSKHDAANPEKIRKLVELMNEIDKDN